MNRMIDKPLISIVVPIYNVEKYLERCLDSILTQNYQNVQIILVNDGATDDSGLICDRYLKLDNRIEVIHKTNGGLSDARNYGIDRARGEYITFIDSDDYVDSEYISYLYDCISNNQCDISVCSYSVVKNGKITDIGSSFSNCVLTPDQAISRMLCDEGFTVSACAKMYRRALFDDVRYPVGKLCEDNGTTYKLFLKANSVFYGKNSHYYYCVRSNSIMTSVFNWKKLDLIELTDGMSTDVLKKYKQLKEAVIRRQLYVRLSVLRQAITCDKQTIKDERIQEIISFVLSHGNEFKNNPKIKKRDAIGYWCLRIHPNFFGFAWKVYSWFDRN